MSNNPGGYKCKKVSVDGRIPVGSKHEARLQVIVQKSVLKTSPKPIPLPPVLTPKPVQFPPTPVKKLEGMFSIPACIQHEKEGKEEMEDETDERSVDGLSSTASQNYTELGQAIAIMCASLKNKNKKLQELNKVVNKSMVEKEGLKCQLKDAEAKNVFLSEKNENVVKKAEEDVTKAKSEQATWMNKYEKLNNSCADLNERLTAAKKESLEKDVLVESLSKKVDEYEKAITDQEVTIKTLEKSEKNLKKNLGKAEKNILKEKENYRNKCLQNTKLTEKINTIQKTTSELQSDINKFMECDKVDKMTIQNLETERDSLNLSIEDLKAKLSEKSEELLKISCELEKEKNDVQVKEVELEKNAKTIGELENKVKVLEKEKDDIENNVPMAVVEIIDQVRDSWIEGYRQKKLSESSLLSSEKEICQEPPSMEVEENDDHGIGNSTTGNKAELLEAQEDVTQTTTPEKRKHPTTRTTLPKKKKCVDCECLFDGQINFNKQKTNTGGDNETPEMKSSSSTCNSSSSSGGMQRSRNGSKQ